MPVSLGFHPYILKAGIDWLRFDAQAVWLTDDARLPTVAAPADTLGDWTVGDSVERSGLIDNCYAGWCGVATMAHRAGSLRVTAGDAAFVHLFMPPGEAFFCLEPVTAMPDAVNRAAPTTLALGESRALTMTIAMN